MTPGRISSCLRLVRRSGVSSQRCRSSKDVRRRFASTSAGVESGSPSPITASPASKLAIITNDLDKIAPKFDVSGDSITILRSPSEFYDTLKVKIRNAKKHIFLATLYVGKNETELIDTIRQALQDNPELKVSLLTDFLRGTRESPLPCCASLLAPLITEFGSDRVSVRLYHTPNLVGLRKRTLPKRINEGWGLQHMKLYGFDDEMIMSGANLSDDYFTNRQDRYHVIRSREVTNYFRRLYQTVCSLSYDVEPAKGDSSGFATSWPSSNAGPAPLDDPKGYIASATAALQRFTTQSLLPQPPSTQHTSSDTQIYPLLQLTPLLRPDTSTELAAVTTILKSLGTQPSFAHSQWTFTAGYFNMTPSVRDLLLQSKPSAATVIAASPWANGFYGSKGVSGLLPDAYTFLSHKFLRAVSSAGLDDRITLKEWRKGTVNTPGGWTYHAKGLWITLPSDLAAKQQQESTQPGLLPQATLPSAHSSPGPSITLVGSSNYTQRSYTLDLEANTLIVTRDPDLQSRLREEECWLQDHAAPVTRDTFARPERRVGMHVRLAMWIVTLVGGAL